MFNPLKIVSQQDYIPEFLINFKNGHVYLAPDSMKIICNSMFRIKQDLEILHMLVI